RVDFYMKQDMFFLKMKSANIIIAIETIVETLIIVLLVVGSRLTYVDAYLVSLLMANSLLFIMFAVIHVYQIRIGYRVRNLMIYI
nr:hypothetical protein [Lachnospiraceae bacterium]